MRRGDGELRRGDGELEVKRAAALKPFFDVDVSFLMVTFKFFENFATSGLCGSLMLC